MATQEEIGQIMELFRKNKPEESFEAKRKAKMGMYAVLGYLHKNKDGVMSKAISEALRVSSARMAVLLKNMEEKGLVEKEPSPTDARAVVVRLSGRGHKVAATLAEREQVCMGQIVDEIGIAEVAQVFATMDTIHRIFHGALSSLEGEEAHD